MNFFARSTFLGLALTASATSAALASAAIARAPLAAQATDLRGARDAGRLAPGTAVRLAIALKLRDAAGLQRLIALQSSPGSPIFRHFLRPEQVRDAFGASAGDYARTVAQLRHAGFTVAGDDPMRAVIDVAAPSATVERYFTTNLHAVEFSVGRYGYANVTPAIMPAELRGTVDTVAGLSTRPVFTTDSAAALASRGSSGSKPKPTGPAAVKAAASPTPAPAPLPTYGPDGGYGPQLVDSAFDTPYRYGYFGSGVAVADIVDGFFSDSADIAPYLSEFNLKRLGPKTTNIVVNGGCATSAFGCADGFQAAVDAEAAIGVSPGISYFVYQIPSLENAFIIDGFKAVVSDDRVDVVNFSVGGCEALLGETAFVIDEEQSLGSAEGITFSDVTFGGSNPCGSNKPSVQAPADSPNGLVAAGADSYADIFGDVTSPPIADASSGGGYSLLFPAPAYQHGVPGVIPSGRNLPDLDGPDAINGVGPSLYYSDFGGWLGGTPFVDNAFVTGALAGVAQIQGTRLGLVNTALYAAAQRNTSLFRDITLGCNGVGGQGPYCAKPGFDQVSGFGAPKFYPLAKAL